MTKMMKDIKDSIDRPKRSHTHVHKHHRSPTRKPRDYRDNRDRNNDKKHRNDSNTYAR